MTDQRQEREHAIACYRDLLRGFSPEELGEYLAPLKGKDLACWCPLSAPCHADVLIKYLKEAELVAYTGAMIAGIQGVLFEYLKEAGLEQ